MNFLFGLKLHKIKVLIIVFLIFCYIFKNNLNEANNKKYLLYECNDENCSGWADRIKGK